MAHMEVLLNEDVDNLGHRGEVVRVRAGYGRNYLLPQGLAIEATAGNKSMIEEHRRVLAKRENRERNSAADQGTKLNGMVLTFERRVGEHGVLFGSVTAMDIAAQLAEQGHKVERRRITLREPIKQIGEHEVVVKLHRDVTPALKIVVQRIGADLAPHAEEAIQAEGAGEAEQQPAHNASQEDAGEAQVQTEAESSSAE